jgi:hypothetical protein
MVGRDGADALLQPITKGQESQCLAKSSLTIDAVSIGVTGHWFWGDKSQHSRNQDEKARSLLTKW